MMAYSSERSDPIGQASCSAGNSRSVRATTALARSALSAIDLDHGGDVDRAMLLVPTVIVGDHGDRRVGDFRFARQFRLCRAGHADDVGAARLEAEQLRQRGELRALDANVGSPVAAGDAFRFSGSEEAAAQQGRDRVGHRDMGDAAGPEET